MSGRGRARGRGRGTGNTGAGRGGTRRVVLSKTPLQHAKNQAKVATRPAALHSSASLLVVEWGHAVPLAACPPQGLATCCSGMRAEGEGGKASHTERALSASGTEEGGPEVVGGED
eukprot:scaffold4675_cov378-Prasinococcus_capsulatus_cf.AAC.10